MKFYKDGNVWVLGDMVVPAGSLMRRDCVDGTVELLRYSDTDKDGLYTIAIGRYGDFCDASGVAYASMEAFKAATNDFFVKAPPKGADDFYITSTEKTQGALATGNTTLDTVKKVADKAVVSVPFKIFTKYADITPIASLTLVLVTQDETNDNYPTFYLHDGVNLNWVVTQ